MTRSKANLNNEIMDYLSKYSPCTARSIAMALNENYNGNVSTGDVASRLRSMTLSGQIVKMESKDNGCIVYRMVTQ